MMTIYSWLVSVRNILLFSFFFIYSCFVNLTIHKACSFSASLLELQIGVLRDSAAFQDAVNLAANITSKDLILLIAYWQG